MLNFDIIRMNQMKRISNGRISDKVYKLFINGENLLYGFESDEGQAIFTNKRIVILTTNPHRSGNNSIYYTLAYSQIFNFRITTIIPGADRVCCELDINTKDNKCAYFSFIENWDILLIGEKISEFVLG